MFWETRTTVEYVVTSANLESLAAMEDVQISFPTLIIVESAMEDVQISCFVLNSFEFLKLSIQNHQFVPPIKKACMEVILWSSRSFIHTYVVTIIQSSNQREH